MRIVFRPIVALLFLLSLFSCAHQTVKPLSEQEASRGSIFLRYEYAKALRNLDMQGVANLYVDIENHDPLSLVTQTWTLPVPESQNGTLLYHDQNRDITPGELPAFIKHFLDSYDKVTRAQIWFSEFNTISKNELAIKVWVEINGQHGKGRRNQRGFWQWQVTRKNPTDPWRIKRHQLLDWDETYRQTPLFAEVAEKNHLRMTHQVGEDLDVSIFIPEVHSGSGAALADYNQDGNMDVFVADGVRNRLFRNQGNGSFEDVSQAAHVDLPGVTRGVVFVDLTGDGLPDLYLGNSYKPNVLLRNRGDGTFEEFTQESGTGVKAFSTSVAVADVDGDGDLDLFVAVYRKPDVFWSDLNGKNGAKNFLFINDGYGHFTEEGEKRGLKETAWSLAASFADYDNDGDQDLFVANDFGPDHFYVNQGNGIFHERSQKIGIKAQGFSMSASWGDYNNDGYLDLYVSKMTSGTTWMFADPRFPMTGIQRPFRKKIVRDLKTTTSGNSLFENQGDGTFQDVAKQTRTDLAHWAWGSIFFDFDNDGDLDIYCANGFWSGENKEDT